MLDFRSSSEFASRVSPEIVVGVIAAAAVALVLSADIHTESTHRLLVLLIALAFYLFAAVGWTLDLWQREHAGWFLVVALVLMATFGYLLTGFSGILILLVVSVAAAASLHGSIASVATAAAQSLMIGAIASTNNLHKDSSLVIFIMMSMWMVTGLVVAMDRVSQQGMEGVWHYYKMMRQELERNRDRSEDLERARDDLMHANRQLTLLNERLAISRLIAEEAQQTKTTFVAKVSHEFRTPLNMIIGLTDLLVETPDLYGEKLPDVLLEDLKIVHRNCAHLSSLIDDVLDLSQTEAGRLVLHREWVNLSANIRDAILVVEPLLQKKELALVVDVPDDLPQVYCDKTRIRQVILNLISNAARYTDQGTITVSAREDDHCIQIDIRDTGPGIPPDSIESIFEPFNQGSYGARTGHGGSGLGLSVSKQFIERHSGKIWVDSEPGMGSTFSFQLPISPIRPPVASAGHWINRDWEWLERSERAPSAKLPNRKRVVVHDPTERNLVRMTYESKDVEVVSVDDVDQLVRNVQTWPAHAILLLSADADDIQLRMMTLKQQLPDTPIVGCCVPDEGDRAAESGAYRYLTKPISREALRSVLDDIGKPVRSVLVVDDDPDVRRLLARMLQSLNGRLEVMTACDGEEALDKMGRSRPDLLLLDIVMPRLDGWGTLQAMNDSGMTDAVPTVIISAQDAETGQADGELLYATVGQGVSVEKLINCSLTLSTMLSYPGGEPDPAPGETVNGERVSVNTALHRVPVQAPDAG